MFGRLLGHHCPIGCDLSAGRVALAQVSSGRVLAAAESIVVAGGCDDPAWPGQAAEALRRALKSAPFRGRRVVATIPARHLSYRPMRLAPMPDAELAGAAHWKIATELGAKSDRLKSSVLAFGDVSDGGKAKREVLAVAADIGILERVAAMLTECGLDPSAIDLSACAVARCLGAAAPGAAGVHVPVLEVDPAAATLFLASHGEVRFLRNVGSGLNRVSELVASLLDLPPAQAASLLTGADVQPDAVAALSGRAPNHTRLAVADAWRMYGRELAREASLSIRYFTDTFRQSCGEAGFVVGLPQVGPEVVEALFEQTGVSFGPADALVGRKWPGPWAGGATKGTGHSADLWVSAIGLSLYEQAAPATAEIGEAA